eukprot:2856077-Amphidinium_carterae.1
MNKPQLTSSSTGIPLSIHHPSPPLELDCMIERCILLLACPDRRNLGHALANLQASVLKAVQAVAVFVLAHVLFCGHAALLCTLTDTQGPSDKWPKFPGLDSYR